MAYGGPASLEDLPGYLADVRRGRATPRAILEELRHNYAAIGGASPLLALTLRQAEALDRALATHTAAGEPPFAVHVGMRHWAPWIEEAVGAMLEDGIERAVGLVLAPQFSRLSVAAYQARVAAGLDAYRGSIAFAHVDGYHDSPALARAFASRIHDALASWPAADRARVHVMFSAHSLPERILAMGDPYDAQVRETARLAAAAADIAAHRWSFCYQSAGRTAERWLGPAIADHLEALATAGVRDVISVPVGFVSDHVEILYDIDVAAMAQASSLGLRLVRPPALNDDPAFIAELARLVRERARAAGWSPAP